MEKIIEHARRPDIAFYKNGMIRIRASLARALHLFPGDCINIAVINGEYFLHAVQHSGSSSIARYEAKCYRTGLGSSCFAANSVRLARRMLDAAGCRTSKVAFMAGTPVEEEDGRIYVPIITQNPITW